MQVEENVFILNQIEFREKKKINWKKMGMVKINQVNSVRHSSSQM